MAEQEELENLIGAMSASAIAQLDEVNAQVPGGPAREANSGVADVVFLSCSGRNLFANSGSGQAASFSHTETTPFARLNLGGKTLFSTLDDFGGSRRFLRGLTESPFGQIDLAKSITDAQTAWNVGTVPGGHLLSLDGPGPKRILSINGLVESIPTQGSLPVPDFSTVSWSISNTPSPGVPMPSPPPVPPPEPITAEAFWWGFHFIIPETLMDEWTQTGVAVGKVIQAASTFAGPASIFVNLFGAFVEAEFQLCRAVDQGNGVFVSMCWFAPGIFVPTTR
jgi:hypothetical protein